MKPTHGPRIFSTAVVATALGFGAVAGCSKPAPARQTTTPPIVPAGERPITDETDPSMTDVGISGDQASEETEISRRRGRNPAGRQK